MVTVTSPDGSVSSLTVYSLLRPATTLSAVGSIVTPTVSSSAMLTVAASIVPALTPPGSVPKTSTVSLVVVVLLVLGGRERDRLLRVSRIEGHAGRHDGVVGGSRCALGHRRDGNDHRALSGFTTLNTDDKPKVGFIPVLAAVDPL